MWKGTSSLTKKERVIEGSRVPATQKVSDFIASNFLEGGGVWRFWSLVCSGGEEQRLAAALTHDLTPYLIGWRDAVIIWVSNFGFRSLKKNIKHDTV